MSTPWQNGEHEGLRSSAPEILPPEGYKPFRLFLAQIPY